MQKFFILFFCLYFEILSAQDIDISGFIKEKETEKAIPFATIEIFSKKLGVAANFQGKFLLKLSKSFENDTLTISSLGYEPKIIQVKWLLVNQSNVTIFLQPASYLLKEVEIVGVPKGKYRLGNYEETKKGYGGFLTVKKSQLAVFMDSKKYLNAKILNACFFISKKSGVPETPFRIRIYKLDKTTGNPGEDLLHENLIVRGKHHGGWMTVDLSKYNLTTPVDGYFIAMEWINSGDQFYYKTYINIINKYVESYGQVCSSSRTIPFSNTWTYVLGTGWHKDTEFFHDKKIFYLNAMITSEIEVFK